MKFLAVCSTFINLLQVKTISPNLTYLPEAASPADVESYLVLETDNTIYDIFYERHDTIISDITKIRNFLNQQDMHLLTLRGSQVFPRSVEKDS